MNRTVRYHSELTVLAPSELRPADWQAWNEIRAAQPACASPFFAAEFTQAVAAVRHDVRIARLGTALNPTGYFPFQVNRLGFAQPIGGRFSDDHGPILAPKCVVSPPALVRSAGLVSWTFAHLPAELAEFPVTGTTSLARYLDLSQGFSAYCAERRAAGSKGGDDLARMSRRITRELGGFRFEWHSSDPRVLEQLITWKRDQYRATGFTDVLAVEWSRQLLTRLASTQTGHLQGVLSALWVPDATTGSERLAAVHLGLASGTALHSWFPAYDPALSKLAPGLAMFGQMAEAAPSHGLTRLRLGAGEEQYKLRLASGTEAILAGQVDAEPGVTALREGWSTAKRWVKSQLTRSGESPLWNMAHGLRERWAVR